MGKNNVVRDRWLQKARIRNLAGYNPFPSHVGLGDLDAQRSFPTGMNLKG